jgi:hypothetical protein
MHRGGPGGAILGLARSMMGAGVVLLAMAMIAQARFH